jgi:hypothetical protein
MNLKLQIKDTLRLKKSNQYCADRLNISLEKYIEIKRQILDEINNNKTNEKIIEFNEDLEKGTANIKGVFTDEPRSPEDIIKVLKIDTTKWKLSNYWNKETNGKWLVSALVTQIKKDNANDLLIDVINNFKPKYYSFSKPYINNKFERPCVGVLSIQDLHFGKDGNDNIINKFKDAVISLITKSYFSHKIHKIIYVIGGDLLNMDTFNGSTTSGTPVDNNKKAYDAYADAFDSLYWSINYIKQFCEVIQVVYIPGNHDRLSSYHLAYALSKCFKDDESCIFNVEYSERKVITYGVNFFGFEHGDVSKKNTPLVYATEFAKEWGSTIYRTCFTGHFHSKKTIEYVTENEHNGFAIKHLPSLSNLDYWHYHNKFIGSKKQAVMEIHDEEYGKISEFTHNSK